MPAGGCRSIFGVSHGRCQPLCHTCKKGDNYAQDIQLACLHLRRASTLLKSSSKQANLLFVGCVGIFLLLFACLVLVQGRECKWDKAYRTAGDFQFVNL